MRNSQKIRLKFLILLFILFFTPTIKANPYYYNLNLNSTNEESWSTIIDEEVELSGTIIKNVNHDIYITGTLGSYVLYIAKYNSLGIKLWDYSWGDSHFQSPYGFIFDSENNLYLVGTTGSKPLLLKFNNLGELLWSKIFNLYGLYPYVTILKDNNNFLYISGYNYDDNVFLIKVNDTGDIIWYREFNVGFLPKRIDLHLDSENNVYVYGGGFGSYLFLVKYNRTGSNLWYNEWGVTEILGLSKIDLNDDFLICGSSLYRNNTSDAWIMRINSSGIITDKIIIGNFHDYRWGNKWYYDQYNNVYFIADEDNMQLFKYDHNFILTQNYSLKHYFQNSYSSFDFVCDSHQNIYLLSNSFKSYHNSDILILKLNTSGGMLHNYTWGGRYRDEYTNLCIDSQDNIYMICNSEYKDQWGLYYSLSILAKNPLLNGSPPILDMRYGYYDAFLMGFMGIMSVISVVAMLSMVIKKSRRGSLK